MTKEDIEHILELCSKYKTLLNNYGINTPLRKVHLFAQLQHESGCEAIQENLNYSAEGLGKTFKKYFPTKELANAYARKPQQIANRVYANRMGNGDEKSGEGYKYKGRGFLQITGKDNYKQLSKDTGIDFVNHPELLLEEVNGLISALWFYKKHDLNSYADKDDVKTISKIINGGAVGLENRVENVKILKTIFK